MPYKVRVTKDERGRACVVYSDDTWAGVYVADGEADALAFAESPERQAADRAFAVQKWRAAHGRPPVEPMSAGLANIVKAVQSGKFKALGLDA